MTEKVTQILLVEDEEAHAELILRAFESQASQTSVTVAHSLGEARTLLAESNPDLVITDLVLPDGKGIELLPADNEEASFPFVVMTSQGDEQVAVQAMKGGALDYVVKSGNTLANMPYIAGRVMREWDHIVQRKRAEEALRFTQFSIDHVSDAAFWMRPDARLIYVNEAACRLLGYSREQLLSMTMREIDPNLPAESWPDHWRDIKERGSSTYESQHRAKNGRFFPVEITVSHLEFGGKEYQCAFARDISERKRAEQELKRQKGLAEAASGELAKANEQLEKAMNKASLMAAQAAAATKAKRDLLANLSQMIRTPVTNITNQADEMLKTKLRHNQREYMDALASSAHALLRLVDSILDLCKIEEGNFRLNAVDFNLPRMVGYLADSFAIRARSKGLEFSYRISGDVPSGVRGDLMRLKQVLTNLIANAVESTEKGEVALEIDLEEVGSNDVRLLFSVRDTGVGIAREKVKDVFEGFAQTGDSTTRGVSRTCLALALTRKLVELMGGRIWVESVHGRGSTFYFNAVLGLSAEKDPPLPDDGRIETLGSTRGT